MPEDQRLILAADQRKGCLHGAVKLIGLTFHRMVLLSRKVLSFWEVSSEKVHSCGFVFECYNKVKVGLTYQIHDTQKGLIIMEFINIAKQRQSVRSYNNKKVEPEKQEHRARQA